MAVLCLIFGPDPLRAAEKSAEKEEVFLKVLDAAYQVSCNDADRLRDYYLANAEIISDGLQSTLDETIKELKQSMNPLPGLTCSYQPKVRASRIGPEMAYLVVRESIRLSVHEKGEQRIEQLCTYVFLKDGSRWKIAHDHCSMVQGETV
ncbi:MAG: nuclear transport factor 2 family protein [Nitrospirae bacterium]|nr:nuclear transport factor 2 family protein [Nitrospirota bacterium]